MSVYMELFYGLDYHQTIPEYVNFEEKTKCRHQAVRWVLLLSNLTVEIAFPIIWGWEPFFHQYGAFTNWT